MALAVGGCGSSGSSGGGNPGDPVASAAAASTSSPGFKMNFTLQMNTPALPSTITATGNGTFDTKDHAGALTMTMQFPNMPQITQALGGSSFTIQELINRLTIYMKFPPALASRMPGGKPWMKIDLAKAAASQGISGLGSLTSNPASSDPSQFLNYLRGSGSFTKVGTEQVAGFSTTHYRGSIDLDKAISHYPSSEQATARQAISKLESALHSKSLPVDVWVDSKQLVRKMSFAMNVSTQGTALSMNMAMVIPEYGPEAAPSLPPADQVFDLTGLTTGAGGGSSSGG